MKKYLMLLAAAGMFTFTACDDDDDEGVALTRTQMLTAKSWKLTARTQVTTDSTGNATTDTTIDDCERDDIYKFNTNNVVTIDEGPTKCDSAAAQITTGTWALADNDTKLNLTINGLQIPGELQQISSSRMVVKSTIDFFDDKIETTSTFSAQ